MRRLAVLLVALAVAGCARPPRPLQGEFPPVSVPDAQRESLVGEHVRWGGTIAVTTPESDRTCIEVVSLPLDGRARPRNVDETFGRFIACAPGFYDPQVYGEKREVTVVGTLEPSSEGKVGEREYLFPRVDAETIYLWPEQPNPETVVYYGGGFYYPWWWGGGWYYPVYPRRHRW